MKKFFHGLLLRLFEVSSSDGRLVGLDKCDNIHGKKGGIIRTC